jgi:hypothetical protein
MLLGLLPLLFFQTAIHEGSHCVLMEVTGIGCSRMAPFAVSIRPYGAVYGITFSDDESLETPIAACVAPQVVAAILILALHPISRRLRSERLALLTRLWLLGACVDVLQNTVALGAFGDWSVLASGLGLSPAQRVGLSLPIWLVVAWGLFVPLPASFSPMATRARDFWEIGLLFAGVSALAAVVATVTEVPGADPTTLWHRVPILLQALSVVACLAVVAASRLTKSVTEREAA